MPNVKALHYCSLCHLHFQTEESLKMHFDREYHNVNILMGVDPIEKTLAERASTYGNFAQEAVLVETIKKALRAHPKWDYLPDDCKLSLEMITLKQVRAVNDFRHTDNWHDIGGYAKLVEDRLREQIDQNPVSYVPLTKADIEENMKRLNKKIGEL